MKGRLGFLILLLIGGLTARTQHLSDNTGFELVRERDNIRIYERWITFPKSDPPVEAREVKGVFFAPGTIDDAIALVRDEKQIGKWQSHVSKFRVYPVSESLWYEYSYHDIPWPVSDQDHYLQYRVVEKKPGVKLVVAFESVVDDNRAPVASRATRMELSGSWMFERSGNRVKITYRITSMPVGIPRVFTDPVIRSNMMTTITSYIQVLKDKNDPVSR